MPRNDNINKHLSAAPSFTMKSFPAEKSKKEAVEGWWESKLMNI